MKDPFDDISALNFIPMSAFGSCYTPWQKPARANWETPRGRWLMHRSIIRWMQKSRGRLWFRGWQKNGFQMQRIETVRFIESPTNQPGAVHE